MENRFFKFEQKKLAEKPENEKKVNDVEKNNSWKEIIKQKYELYLSKLKESADRLRKIRKIEKESGINTDESEEEIIAEIKNISKEIKTVAPKKEKEKIADKKEKPWKVKLEKGMPERERRAAEKYNKSIEDLRNIKNTEKKIKERERENDPIANTEKLRKELIKHVESEEYLGKLLIECEGNIKKAKDTQRKRLEYLKTVNANTVPTSDVDKEYPVPSWLIPDGWSPNGFYNPINHEVFVPDDGREYRDYNDSVTKHEFLHSSTRAMWNILSKTNKLLRKSYQPYGVDWIYDIYLGNSSERLVRKQMLDLEMAKLGIKDYGVKFTKDHYKKMVEAYKDGKFSYDAEEFIETTRPEYFEKVFNEIADNNKNNKNETIA